MSLRHRSLYALTAAAAVLAGGLATPVQADDTEIFLFNPPSESSDRPNVLFILDTGESMSQPLGAIADGDDGDTPPQYDPDEDYDLDGSGCRGDRLYFGFVPPQGNPGQPEPNSCEGLKYVTLARFKCNAAMNGLDTQGYATQNKMIYYGPPANPTRWDPLTATAEFRLVDCGADAGSHADGSGSYNCNGANNNCYPVDSGVLPYGLERVKVGNKWVSNLTPALNSAPPQTFFTANRVGYRRSVEKWLAEQEKRETRMTALKNALTNVLDSVSGINVALMRFSGQGGDANATKGGMVLHAFEPVEDARAKIKALLEDEDCGATDVPCMLVEGRKPIGQTMYEAYRYYAGQPVEYGVESSLSSEDFPSVWQSWSDSDPHRSPSRSDKYRSPIGDQQCNTDNYIILLTDGFTEGDNRADGGNKIGDATDFPRWADTPFLATKPAGTCDWDVYADGIPSNKQLFTDADGDPVDEKLGNVTGTPPGAANGSNCVDDIAGYMWSIGVTDQASGREAKVATYAIGFDLDRFDELGNYGKMAKRLLMETAERGGGNYYDAKDQAGLESSITTVIRKILLENASFTSPSVAVNSFNRVQNLNDLYLSVFKPDWTYRWKGNVKRYKLVPTADAAGCGADEVCDPNDIRDQKGRDAVELDNGEILRFSANAWSYWSDAPDGFDAAAGGAAGELKDPERRKIYTNVAAESGTLSDELSDLRTATPGATLKTANALLLGVDSSDPVDNRTPVTTLIDWAYGIDVADQVGAPGTVTDARLDMGDPLHSKPAVISYGGTPASPDVTVYVTTNDGFLHAIDADDGSELWAFVPRQLLRRLEKLYLNEEVIDREYGLDSPIRTLRYDRDNDGQIEPADGDRVILYFGMRRGGAHYFALDVTSRSSPKLLWRIGANDDGIAVGSTKHLPGIGQTWSVPAIARVNVKDFSWANDNTLKWVLVFGGGYNTNHDQLGYKIDGEGNRVFDTAGNRIYMVDAMSGKLIWRAGPSTDTGADLQLASMKNAIASDVRIFDLSDDGFADRMYASDLGGQIWRFDIYNGRGADELVTGGRFASLGNGDAAKPGDETQSRRFFYAPDPALITYGGESWINIAIGSGHREKPLYDAAHNRAYGLRDYRPFTRMTQDEYDAWEDEQLIRDTADDAVCNAQYLEDPPAGSLGTLLDVTGCVYAPIPRGSRGWKLDINAGGSWSGEKVLAETITFQNIIYVPSYEPGSSGDACAPPIGVNRLYAISAINGADDRLWRGEIALADASIDDRVLDVKQGGISPPVVIVFPGAEGENADRTPKAPPEGLIGLGECCDSIGMNPVRTYWRQRGTQ